MDAELIWKEHVIIKIEQINIKYKNIILVNRKTLFTFHLEQSADLQTSFKASMNTWSEIMGCTKKNNDTKPKYQKYNKTCTENFESIPE